MCAFFPVRSYIISTLKSPFFMWLTECIITNVLFHITSSGGTPNSFPIFNDSLNAFIACPLTEIWLATRHLIRNHTFPSLNIGVCGVLIKCCTKTTGIPSDSFFSCFLSKNLGGKNPQIFLFLEFSHNPPLQVSKEPGSRQAAPCVKSFWLRDSWSWVQTPGRAALMEQWKGNAGVRKM